MELDPDIAAMKKANRRPLWVGLGVVGAAVALSGSWVAGGAGAVRAALEAEGHTDIEVKITSPFDYGYTSKKRDMACGGTFTRLPFSTSRQGGCFGGAVEPPPKPARPEHETLAERLGKQFPSLPVSGARCDRIDPGAKQMRCSLESDAGAPLDVVLERSEGDWKIKSPERIVPRTKLAETLAEELQQKVKAPVAVDCGVGLFGYAENDHLSCSATRKGAKKAGSIEITFGGGGGYTWKATGI